MQNKSNLFFNFAFMKETKKTESPIVTLTKQRALLLKEYAYEKEEFQRLSEATGIDSKVRRGLAWYPLTLGRSYHNSLDQFVVEVKRAGDTEEVREEDASLFEPGKPVYFFSEDAYVLRCLDTYFDLVTLDLKNSYLYIITEHDRLVYLP
jgi:hypothetical protein